MKLSTVLAPMLLCPLTAFCHPGSGIAADAQGNVFFMDTGAGVWQLRRSGVLHKVPGRAYHWLALDRTGRLADTALPTFNEGSIERTQHNLLLSSDFPLTIDSQGVLYFPRKQDGRLFLFRLEPTGSVSAFATVAERRDGTAPGWINGSVVGPDGTLYYTEDHGVWKIPVGRQAVAIPIDTAKSDCRSIPGLGSDDGAPMFQGIAVDEQGNVFVAATGCRSVIKIDRNNMVTTIVKTTDTWSPTGVAILGSDLYVLEYLHTEGHNRREWIPRIRKLGADGSETIVATVERK
jgi:sugar lactone lactonase YvrE